MNFFYEYDSLKPLRRTIEELIFSDQIFDDIKPLYCTQGLAFFSVYRVTETLIEKDEWLKRGSVLACDSWKWIVINVRIPGRPRIVL